MSTVALREGMLSIYDSRDELGQRLIREHDLDVLFKELGETVQPEFQATLIEYRRKPPVTVSCLKK